jgi:hypothetical protein
LTYNTENDLEARKSGIKAIEKVDQQYKIIIEQSLECTAIMIQECSLNLKVRLEMTEVNSNGDRLQLFGCNISPSNFLRTGNYILVNKSKCNFISVSYIDPIQSIYRMRNVLESTKEGNTLLDELKAVNTIMVKVKIDIGSTTVSLYCVHISPRIQTNARNFLFGVINEMVSKSDSELKIVGGDWNRNPSHISNSFMKGEEIAPVLQCKAIKLNVVAPDCITCNDGNSFSDTIDYFFTNFFATCNVVGSGFYEPSNPSDHVPVRLMMFN